ncbi:Uma2 family endonuclease [Nostoc sp. NIES-2111]
MATKTNLGVKYGHMSRATLYSVDEDLRLTEKPYREYRDGLITAKSIPTKLHALVMRVLLRLLEEQGLEAYPELTLRISDSKFLVPDITVTDDFAGPYPSKPVEICCEILSPEDRLGATLGKCEEYHAWGVPFCWVIDPVKQSAWEYHANAEPFRVSEALRAGEHQIPLEPIFAAIRQAQ